MVKFEATVRTGTDCFRYAEQNPFVTSEALTRSSSKVRSRVRDSVRDSRVKDDGTLQISWRPNAGTTDTNAMAHLRPGLVKPSRINQVSRLVLSGVQDTSHRTVPWSSRTDGIVGSLSESF